MDAARFLPDTRERTGFVRFGAADERIPREGIFVLASRALRDRALEPWEADELRDCLAWFNRHMRVCRPRETAAILFLRDHEREMAQHLWQLAHLLRDVGVFVDMVAVRAPGRITDEDEIQVAAVPRERR